MFFFFRFRTQELENVTSELNGLWIGRLAKWRKLLSGIIPIINDSKNGKIGGNQFFVMKSGLLLILWWRQSGKFSNMHGIVNQNGKFNVGLLVRKFKGTRSSNQKILSENKFIIVEVWTMLGEGGHSNNFFTEKMPMLLQRNVCQHSVS